VGGKAGDVLKILLDTDVVSQLTKDVPHPKASFILIEDLFNDYMLDVG
jgi:hypothetical protein